MPSIFWTAPVGKVTTVTDCPIMAEYMTARLLLNGSAAASPLVALSNTTFPVGVFISARTDSITCRSVAVPSAATLSTIVRMTWLIV
jgi:hypothetical protein